ncbi:hypothetical protein MPTK1_4g22240 [Marchantia polymorpha subsp. ruderalis]|uniref:Uncharacterized protein n=1 Tax=Marchantia polymorpha subsp. ruderalis TaxID=1480154 RepID=A0AAF6BCK3_MARPO|nr:hypothetical protein Mp_4g22240 [Marchantia polymorpha subsp. ruderalis]
MCFYYVAQSQIFEAESRKLPSGRKGKNGGLEDSEIRNSPSNGLALPDFEDDDTTQTEDSDARKRKLKGSSKLKGMQNVVTRSNSSTRMGRKKRIKRTSRMLKLNMCLRSQTLRTVMDT